MKHGSFPLKKMTEPGRADIFDNHPFEIIKRVNRSNLVKGNKPRAL